MAPDYFLCASFGNDSLALIQWAHERGLRNVVVLYNNTGWAHPAWAGRVKRCRAWAESLGFETHETESMGMPALVKWKRGWPRQGIQFCTEHLKIIPSIAFMAERDPLAQAICLVGKRRAESRERSNAPEWMWPVSANGNRAVWQPLVEHSTEARDALLDRAGFKPLPHRSRECNPCVNSSRADIVLFAKTKSEVAKVRNTEADAGLNKKGGARTMFRPKSKGGALGIDEVIDWAKSGRGRYVAGQMVFDLDDDTGSDCLSETAGCGA